MFLEKNEKGIKCKRFSITPNSLHMPRSYGAGDKVVRTSNFREIGMKLFGDHT